MKMEEIKELIGLLEKSSIDSMEITEGDTKVVLRKSGDTVKTAAPETLIQVKPDTDTDREKEEAHIGKLMKSPMVGVFYQAASPEAQPFVSIGQHVKKGQTLCVIEAMKLMNEITAEADGEITEICVCNGQIVEFGQPLFYVK